jgi:sporadic carbohydrate cluster protein (TIGR04323 family)
LTSHGGFRGYVSSRPIGADRVPQHVQNIVIRNYCRERNLEYLLSATEIAMTGCFLALKQVLAEISNYQGVVFYSIDQLPLQSDERQECLSHVVAANREVHFAVEGLIVSKAPDIERIEDLIRLKSVLNLSAQADELKVLLQE